MIRPMMMLSLLLAIPAVSDNPKTPTKQEMIQLRATVKNLQDMVAEQQDRLQAHKIESDGLKKRMSTLESRIADLENAACTAGTAQETSHLR